MCSLLAAGIVMVRAHTATAAEITTTAAEIFATAAEILQQQLRLLQQQPRLPKKLFVSSLAWLG